MSLVYGFLIVFGAAIIAFLTTWFARLIINGIATFVGGLLALHPLTRIFALIIIHGGYFLSGVAVPLAAFDASISSLWAASPEAVHWPAVGAFIIYAIYAVVVWIMGLLVGIAGLVESYSVKSKISVEVDHSPQLPFAS